LNAGFFHEALLYDSDEDFLSVVIPFLETGVEMGDITLVALNHQHAELVRLASPAAAEWTFLSGAEQYSRPASAIQAFREQFGAIAAAGCGRRVRVVGEVLDPEAPEFWEPWARYEAAINEILREFPVWGLCPYSTRTTPEHVLTDVARTHPNINTNGHQAISRHYVEPETFLRDRPSPHPDAFEAGIRQTHLVDPSPLKARRAIRDLAYGTPLHAEDVEGLLWGASEAITNAHLHGRPPVIMRAWSRTDRILVTISDSGDGLTCPYAGLLPAINDVGGRGLWLTHQMCQHVVHDTRSDGFTIRLTAHTNW
jgi:anti-sigma regulatory factor (Ser/Thr protein kinase)